MALRIETPMALTRPVEAVADKAHEMGKQGLNAPAMKRDEAVNTERKLSKAQAAEGMEHRRIQEDERDRRREKSPGREEPEEREEPGAEDQMSRLKRRASQKILNLPVEPSGKKTTGGERRIDITL